MFDLLTELCSLRGVAGDEGQVRDYIRKQAANYADEMNTDPAGNLLVFKKGQKRRSKPVMLVSQMDESGFRIQKINPDGTLTFATTGSIEPVTLFGSRVLVGPKAIPGVIMTSSQFVRMRKDRKLPSPQDYFIDIGAQDSNSAEKLVNIGDAATLLGEWRDLPHGRFKARALEGRLGCAVLLSLLQEELAYDTWFVFSALDSIKVRNACGRGSSVAASAIQPKSILFVEAREAFDFAVLPSHLHRMSLGAGGVVVLADRGSCYTCPLVQRIVKKAAEAGVRHQYPTALGFHLPASRTAVPSCASASSMCMAAPVRYLYTANAVADREDIIALKAMSRIYLSETEAYHD
jgi:putative aminopeptidase FrvX